MENVNNDSIIPLPKAPSLAWSICYSHIFSLHYPLFQMPTDQCTTIIVRQNDGFSNDSLDLK